MHLKVLMYTSIAKLNISDRQLNDIHQTARTLNGLDGITGILLFDGIRFLQIIEGADEAIDNLVERLRRDSRHSAFEILDERLIEVRSFPDWSMELLRISTGYQKGRTELAPLLPETILPPIRDMALRIMDELAVRR